MEKPQESTENITPENEKKPEVHIHMANFLPWSSVVRNKTLMQWTAGSGADKLEWIAVGPISDKVPIGPTHEVLSKPVSALQEIFGKKLGHGHVIFNPFASFWGILGRKSDPYRPEEPLALYNLLLANEEMSRQALKKLELVKKGKFPVVVYPQLHGEKPKNDYSEPYIQTHPAVLDDPRGADAIIKAIEAGDYSKVCVDTFHFQEATKSGVRPFGDSEKELFRSLEKFYKAGVLGEVHVQPGRLTHLDETIRDERELKAIFGENPNYDTRLGRMLKFLIHGLGFMGPYTFEVDPRALVKIYGQKVLLPPDYGNILEAQGAAIDYIRRT